MKCVCFGYFPSSTMVIMNRIALLLFTLFVLNVHLQATSKEVRRLRRSGPNLCGGRLNPYCCSGWQPSSQDSSLCLAPVCTSNCGVDGACIKPNLCQCGDGQLASTCQPNTDGCKIRCLNGASCKDDKCQCLQGYTGQYCENAICDEPCQNGGRCIKPNICACSLGFGGPQCQADYRQGPCYKEIKDLACKGQVSTLICTKDLCCATVGKAWGSPCEKCPTNPEPCRKGYIPFYETRDCLDINECEAVPDVCGPNGKCTNTIGSYSCQRCRAGFKYDEATKRCEDINECADDRSNQCLNGRCSNTIGSYQCVCDQGYVLSSDGTNCVWPDVRPTVSPSKLTHGCYGQILGGVCLLPITSTNTSKEDCCCGLVTAAGWSSTCQRCPTPNTREYRELCSSVAICKSHGEACANGVCTQTTSGFECVCNAGFVASTTGRCVDIDECASDHGCVNSYCRNTIGSFVCICRSNFVKTINRLVCQMAGPAVRVCANDPNLCQNGRCIDKENDYECVCASGFKQSRDRKICLDVNECLDSTTCQNGQCSNTVGSWRCTCNLGFKLSPDKKFCIDINECQTISGVCANGVCINTVGDYRCKCNNGYTLSTDRHMCLDTMLSRCYASFTNNVCSNMIFRSLTLSQCCCGMDNTIARPRAWGTPCEPCPYVGTDKHKELCMHGPGKDSGGKDINECANNIGAGFVLCPNGQCRNTKGDYFCVCNAGYRATEDGKKCEEVDECLENTDLCRGGKCVDTPGSFKCICPKGYFFDARTKACEDEDECKNDRNCIDGTCINTVGSYRCQCLQGMTLHESGKMCEDKRQGKCWRKITNNICEDNVNGGMTRELCCQTLGEAWGSPCTKCPTTGTKCKAGFQYKNFTCVDIDECSSFDDLCQNGRCVNTLGGYECRCSPGLTLDETKSICKDERKAVCYQTIYPDRCTKPVPGLHKKDICCCFVGGGWGEPCEECPIRNTRLDECRQFPGICSNGDCIDTADGFQCNCRAGFALDETGRNCTDINECGLTPGLCGNGTCLNIPGGFRCNCYSGFKNAPMMMEICIDVNECEDLTNPCQGGSCVNTIGSFKCQCPEGKRMDPSGLMCQDINECAENPRICRNGICQNFVGGYQCSCYRGFKPSDDMKDCIDRDECSVNNGGCQSLCVNTPGSFKCDCPEGLRLTIDRKTCEDVNECTEIPDICGVGNKCRNVIGGHICSCTEGYTISEDRKSCIDINECANDSTLCSNGKCVNLIGFYRCECDVGYKWDSVESKCLDVDECDHEEGVAYCDSNSECVNTIGSYSCNCKLGYQSIGDNCVDIDECLPQYEKCTSNEKCVNTLGSYNCDCIEGYRFEGITCRDIDECRERGSYCTDGVCMNLPGSYKCECDLGYMESEDEKTCDDFDECAAIEDICHHGKCINIPGSFRCQCDKGFQLNKNQDNCTDMNECTKTGMCLNGRCINEMGRYRCECDEDFVPNPTQTACVDTRRGPCYLKKGSGPDSCENLVANSVLKTYCCCSVGAAWNDPCETCPSSDTAEFKHLCSAGYGFAINATSTSALDINECLFPNICENGTCVNTRGSYKCNCKDGFRYNKMYGRCEDINECEDDAYICGYTGVCFNLYGSYRCECPVGEEKDGSLCIDYRVHNCYRDDFDDADIEGSSPGGSATNCNTAKLAGRMTRTACCCSLGSAFGSSNTCTTCPKKGTIEFKALCGGSNGGLQQNKTGTGGVPGKDVDECKNFGNPCVNGKCINTYGSYTCECGNGFATGGTPETCKDKNECLTEPCINGQCKNTHGSFMCTCSKGYTIDETGIQCVDMNECHRNTTCLYGKCVNLVGDYRCMCNPGFRIAQNNKACEDINECSTNGNICRDGDCVNTLGTYKCRCNDGYREDQRHRCQDIDECVEQRDQICRNSRFCVNTVGGFTCECRVGYTLDESKRNCRDVDECTEIKDFCLGGTCTNTIGGTRCECSNGFRLHPSGDRCVDINECDEDPNLCQMGGECINSLGSFSCSCPEGYEVANSGKMCVDMRKDYCFEIWDNQGCSQIKMTNVTKSQCCCVKGAAWGVICELCPTEQTEEFSLLCPKGTGYIARKNEIEDVNECEIIPNLCKNGRCINSDGSYRCQCFDGYVLDSTGRNCQDKDECLITPGICGNGTCTNIPGSYSCLCATGFQNGLESPTCQDINECAYDRSLCAFRCINIPGGYQCMCPRGYILHADGKHCTDLDECETRVHDCAHICKNFVGGYKCVCPPGHRRVGSRQCVDIDECRERVGLCHHGSCRNTAGDYICDCSDGYKRSQDGRSCEDLSVGYCFSQVRNGICKASAKMMVMITRASCCCSDGSVAWGDDCTLCPLRGSNARRQLCTGERRVVNECVSIPGRCPNGKCIDTADSYRCMCNPGYQLSSDGKRCIDMDECAQIPKPCPYKCTNQPGTYLCECPEGFQQSLEERGCEDIDECANNTHNCPKACVNTIGSYTCDCGKGYVTRGSTCIDEDECRKYPSICGYGRCLNQQGSYTCVCNRGFKYDAQKKKCVDMNECNVRTCQGTCLNVNGGYRCGCAPGFVRQLYWNQCVDIDECRTGANKCGRTQCLNIRGGYRCTCSQGYQLDRMTMSCTDTNECRRNPCAKSNCYNIGGGFQCTCPQGFVAIGGGHCISKYGQRCYDCAKQTRPLIPKKITTEHKYKFGEKPKKKPKVTPALYSSHQKIQTYGTSHTSYTPYKPQQPDPYRYTYTYTSSSSSGGRKRRMSRAIHKLKLSIPHNVTTSDKLLVLTPVLQTIQKHFQYEIITGNKFLFGIKVDEGLTILHCKKSLQDQHGKRYRLLLKGRFNHGKEAGVLIGEEEIEFMAEKKGKIIKNKKTKSVFGEQEAKKFHLEISIKIV